MYHMFFLNTCPCLIVYSVDEELWKKYIPPVRVHKDYGSGWAMLGDLLLCLPLSVFIQVIQINYMVSLHAHRDLKEQYFTSKYTNA